LKLSVEYPQAQRFFPQPCQLLISPPRHSSFLYSVCGGISFSSISLGSSLDVLSPCTLPVCSLLVFCH
jgi:hypothetical protein